MRGKYLLPPIGTFSDLRGHMTSSAVFFSSQFPGKTIETREIVQWDLVAAPGGISAAIDAIIAPFVR